jgi:hypothetical protein
VNGGVFVLTPPGAARSEMLRLLVIMHNQKSSC